MVEDAGAASECGDCGRVVVFGKAGGGGELTAELGGDDLIVDYAAAVEGPKAFDYFEDQGRLLRRAGELGLEHTELAVRLVGQQRALGEEAVSQTVTAGVGFAGGGNRAAGSGTVGAGGGLSEGSGCSFDQHCASIVRSAQGAGGRRGGEVAAAVEKRNREVLSSC